MDTESIEAYAEVYHGIIAIVKNTICMIKYQIKCGIILFKQGG